MIVDRALAELDADLAAMYSRVGRPSIAPERLLKASLLIALYTVRSERQFCERLQSSHDAHRLKPLAACFPILTLFRSAAKPAEKMT